MSEAASSRPDRILLLHGTFAGREAEGNWWNEDSDFAKALAAHIREIDPGREVLFERCPWDPIGYGANLESVRRAAGRVLLERLRELGDQPYHLIGHSHGGSVIWNALIESLRDGKGELTGLRSWTTVGTPFLNFRPLLRSTWPLAPTIAAVGAAVLVAVNYLPLLDRLPAALRFAPNFWINLIWAVLFGAAAIGLFAVALLGIVATFGFAAASVRALGRRRDRIAAYKAYGDRRLGLYHPLDEVLSGMKVSLRSPPKIVPRWAVVHKDSKKRRELPVAELWSRPADQLVWQLLGRNVQGDDLVFENLASASPAPNRFDEIAAGYDADEVKLHDDSTRGAATNLLFDFRTAFAREADGRPYRRFKRERRINPRHVFGIVDWNGIIHTSYFGQVATVRRIAARICGRENVVAGPPVKRRGLNRSYLPRALVFWSAVLSTALVLGLGLLAAQSATSVLRPFALSSAEDALFAQAEDPRLYRTYDGEFLGSLLARLERIAREEGRPFDLASHFQRMELVNAGATAAQAFAVANAGGWEEGDLTAFTTMFAKSREGYGDEQYRGSAEDAKFAAEVSVPLMAATSLLVRGEPADRLVPSASGSLPAAIGTWADKIAARGTFTLQIQAQLLFSSLKDGALPPALHVYAAKCGTAEDYLAPYLVEFDQAKLAVDLLSGCETGTLLRAWLLAIGGKLSNWPSLVVGTADSTFAGTRFACERLGDCSRSGVDGILPPANCGSPACEATRLLGLPAADEAQARESVRQFLAILDAVGEFEVCKFPVRMAPAWQIYLERADAEQRRRLDDITFKCLASADEFRVDAEENKRLLARLVAISAARDDDSALRALDGGLEAELASADPLFPQVSAALAAKVRLELGETARARAAIETGIVAIGQSQHAVGGAEAWLLDLAVEIGDQGLIDRTFAAATHQAQIDTDRAVARDLAREIAFREMERENYPAAIQLLSEFSGNTEVKLQVLIGMADSVLKKRFGIELPVAQDRLPDPFLDRAAN